ncbi:MAG: PAS domain S-box protein [Syntrophomonadaceae bacterium]|nr:PAS domain S-box protein [Syntrophomonadaceae bacterium]
MGSVSIITLLSAIIYIYLAVYAVRLKPTTRLNRIFVALCLTCAWWAFCIAMMFPAPTYEQAWLWFRLSAPGWCLGPTVLLHFTLVLIEKQQARPAARFRPVLYVPPLIFMVMGMTHGVTATTLFHASFGWSPLNVGNTLWYWAFTFYYVTYITLAIVLVWRWGKASPLNREKRLARTVATCTITGTLLAFLNESLLPVIGFADIPKIPVVLWLIWAYGLWFAITKYRLMIVSPVVATNEIVRSIDDLMIMVDLKGKIIEINHRVEDLLLFQKENLLYRSVDNIAGDPELLKAIANQLKHQPESLQQETELKTRDDQCIPVHLAVSSIADDFGDVVCLVLVARDLRPTQALQNEISERVRAENALKQSMEKLKETSIMQEEQNQKLERQNAELEAMAQSLAYSNTVLAQTNLQLENLFNNVGQGFLSFGEDLSILPQFSRECIEILKGEPVGKRLSSLIYPDNSEQSSFMDEVFFRVLRESDPNKSWLYLSLLPEEALVNNRQISMEYKKVADQQGETTGFILVILTDITEKRALQKQLVDERNMFSMVVKSIVNHNDLVQCIEDFDYFITCELPELALREKNLSSVMAETLRAIHTFKGNFSQFDVYHVVEALHQLEEIITQNRNEYSNLDNFLRLMRDFDLYHYLEKDLDIIRDLTGQDLMQRKGTCAVNEDSLRELEAEISSLLSPAQCQALLPRIRNLRHKSFKDLLKSYPDYIDKLALRLGKQVYPVVITGDDMIVDGDYYKDFAKSLVHVFRNSLDHGVEDPDERQALGKNPAATISCRITATTDYISLAIADDGTGIDLDKVRGKALAHGLISEPVEEIPDEDLLSLIFADQFSTREEVTVLSGRGIGLAAIRTECDKLDGTIQVVNHPGQGCEFIFELPIQQEVPAPTFCINSVIDALSDSVRSFMMEQADLIMQPVSSAIGDTDSLFLSDSTVIMTIRGTIDAMIIVALNDKLIEKMLSVFVMDDIDEPEKNQLYPDLLAECANIIIGASLKNWGQIKDLITLESPVIVSNHGFILRHPNSPIAYTSMKSGDYRITVGIALLDR